MKASPRVIAVPVASLLVAAFAATTGTASATTVNFGCTTPDNQRAIVAEAYYSANGPSQWKVTKIVYSYDNSGGGKTNTRFRVYNGDNAIAFAKSTPDNRDDNQRYTMPVNKPIKRGSYARAYQRTYFDVFGNDPSCSKAAKFK